MCRPHTHYKNFIITESGKHYKECKFKDREEKNGKSWLTFGKKIPYCVDIRTIHRVLNIGVTSSRKGQRITNIQMENWNTLESTLRFSRFPSSNHWSSCYISPVRSRDIGV